MSQRSTLPLTDKTGKQIVEALSRQAAALETLVLMAQVFLSEEEPAPARPQTIMTQHGPVELR